MLKKYFLGILIFLCVNYSFAQNSLSLFDIGSVNYGTASANIESYASLVNNAPYQISVAVKRKIIQQVIGSESFFCWDVCYLAQVDSSLSQLTIGPNDTLYNFYGSYNGQGNPGLCVIEYCFFDIDFPSDSVCYRANYYGGVTGIETLETAKEGAVMYPNPSQGQATLTYKTQNAGNYSFVLVDVTGQIVRNQNLQTGFSGDLNIDLSELSNGLYTYQLWRNNTAVTSGKFALKH